MSAPEQIGLVAGPFGYALWNSEEYAECTLAIPYVRADLYEALKAEGDEARYNLREYQISNKRFSDVRELQIIDLKTENEILRAALERSTQALDDWVVTYASELCLEASVSASRARILEGGGTLAYVAQITDANRKLLGDAS